MSNDEFDPKGVIPACLMPFDSDLEIDEAAYRRHLSDLASIEGITAITVNGHAAEVHALSFEEQRRGIEIARDEVGGELPLVAGIHTGNTRESCRLANMAAAAGADALLVFPSDVLAMGGQQRPECASAHIGAIAESTELPLILFQYPSSGGLVTRWTAIPGPWDRLDANGTKRQSGETYRKRGRITFSSVL
ncbi:MAG: 4-hydroxy-tetrahydrodipicolinate synthase [Planctomycetaceae bacterium]|jgi:4-hydroxy-tetrahydrodipicolinate synthase